MHRAWTGLLCGPGLGRTGRLSDSRPRRALPRWATGPGAEGRGRSAPVAARRRLSVERWTSVHRIRRGRPGQRLDERRHGHDLVPAQQRRPPADVHDLQAVANLQVLLPDGLDVGDREATAPRRPSRPASTGSAPSPCRPRRSEPAISPSRCRICASPALSFYRYPPRRRLRATGVPQPCLKAPFPTVWKRAGEALGLACMRRSAAFSGPAVLSWIRG